MLQFTSTLYLKKVYRIGVGAGVVGWGVGWVVGCVVGCGVG